MAENDSIHRLRRQAESWLEADPDLQGEHVSLISRLLEHRYAERLKLFSVG